MPRMNQAAIYFVGLNVQKFTLVFTCHQQHLRHRFFGLINVNLFHKMCWHFGRWILCANILFIHKFHWQRNMDSWAKQNVAKSVPMNSQLQMELYILADSPDVVANINVIWKSHLNCEMYTTQCRFDNMHRELCVAESNEEKNERHSDSAYSIKLVCIFRTYWVSLKINVDSFLMSKIK